MNFSIAGLHGHAHLKRENYKSAPRQMKPQIRACFLTQRANEAATALLKYSGKGCCSCPSTARQPPAGGRIAPDSSIF